MCKGKLIRDKIPELLKENNIPHQVRRLSDEEYITALREKLIEEVEEFLEEFPQKDGWLHEMSDVLEVLMACLEVKGVTFQQLERCRQEKGSARGLFKERLFLLSNTK